MTECPHLKDGVCMISTALAGMKVPAAADACAACARNEKPKQANRITYSKAVYTLYKSGKPIPKKLTEKLRTMAGSAPASGPGTELSNIISWFKKANKTCGCSARIAKMNVWGPDKCEQNIDTIARWLKVGAKKQGLPYIDSVARGMIKMAIKRSRKSAQKIEEEAAKAGVVIPSTESQEPRQLAPRVHIPSPKKKWAVAITTAPRSPCTLEKTVQSVVDAGWEPVVFAEPGSTKVDVKTFWNDKRLGVWHNWKQAANWCLEQQPEIAMTVQDDAHFHPESMEFAEHIVWPRADVGYVSLYCPQHYQHWKDGSRRPFGVYPVQTRSVWGAMALMFPPPVLSGLLDHRRARYWWGAKVRRKKGESRGEFKRRWELTKQNRRENPHLIQNSDTAIGIILRDMNRKLLYASPSPVDHFATVSSIGHGGNEGKRNAEYIADRSRSLFDQIPCSPGGPIKF